MESELTRAKEKTTFLEEKIQTLKEGFKTKEAESKESHLKDITNLESKMSDLRSRLKSKDDEFNEVTKSVKALKAEHEVAVAEIERLQGVQQNLNLEIQLINNNHLQQAKA